MTARPPEHLVHGINGPVVIISARVCAYLNRYAALEEFRIAHRGTDQEVDNTLVAMALAARTWRSSATGTTAAEPPEPAAPLEWLSTTQAATRLGVTPRAITKAISEKRIQADSIDGKWRISPESLAHYKAHRAA